MSCGSEAKIAALQIEITRLQSIAREQEIELSNLSGRLERLEESMRKTHPHFSPLPKSLVR